MNTFNDYFSCDTNPSGTTADSEPRHTSSGTCPSQHQRVSQYSCWLCHAKRTSNSTPLSVLGDEGVRASAAPTYHLCSQKPMVEQRLHRGTQCLDCKDDRKVSLRFLVLVGSIVLSALASGLETTSWPDGLFSAYVTTAHIDWPCPGRKQVYPSKNDSERRKLVTLTRNLTHLWH